MSLSRPLAPDRPILFQCENCKQTGELNKYIREENLPEPHQTTTEIILFCPECGQKKHSHYMSIELVVARREMLSKQAAATNLSYKQKFERINHLRKEYNQIFDSEQEKYRQIMEKVVAEDGRTT